MPPEIHTSVELVSTVGGNQSNADIQYFVQGPDLAEARQVLRRPAREDEDHPRRGGRGHLAAYRQAGAPPRDRPPARGRSRRLACTTSSRRSTRWSPARSPPRSTPAKTSTTSASAPRSSSAAAPKASQDDRAIRQARLRAARRGRPHRARHRAVVHQPHQPPAPGHAHRQRAARRLAGRVLAKLNEYRDQVRHGPGVSLRTRRHVEGTRPHRLLLHDRHLAVVHLHVHRAGGAVRVVHPPDHDSADAAAGRSVRHPVAARRRPDREHLLRPRPAAAVRHRQEERDSADRPHQRPARAGHEALRRHHAGQPRPAPPDSDDDHRAGRRHAAARHVERRRRGDQPLHRRARGRRAVAVPAADAAGRAGLLLAVRGPRRLREEDSPQAQAQARRGGRWTRSARDVLRGAGRPRADSRNEAAAEDRARRPASASSARPGCRSPRPSSASSRAIPSSAFRVSRRNRPASRSRRPRAPTIRCSASTRIAPAPSRR